MKLENICAANADDLILMLERGEFSLLKSMRKKIFCGSRITFDQFAGIVSWQMGLLVMNVIVGPACRFVLFCILLGGGKIKNDEYWQKKRAKAVKVIAFFFPDKTVGEPDGFGDASMIVGFNHPTLHEAVGIIGWSLKKFPGRRNIFPANTPWYESVCIRSDTLKKMGICLTPLITPNTFKKLNRMHANDNEMTEIIKSVSDKLLNRYFSEAIVCIGDGGNVFAAPSSTRQPCVFPKPERFHTGADAVKLPPVMSSLMLRTNRAFKNKPAKLVFLPVTIIPPGFRMKRFNGLKLFRRYKMVVGKEIFADEAIKAGRSLDREFLLRIAENAPPDMRYPK
ncbi:MAG: hypothetical protein FWE82_08595 [Defluviitaleaceae bacterium]|nr:hypothetical protein [Defluviitaleaceae bacterium]